MGTEARIALHASKPENAERAAAAAFARIAELDRALSDYRVDGELAALAARAGGEPLRVSDELYTVLRRALDLAHETDGAFDPTIGPLTAAWREARLSGTARVRAPIAGAAPLVDWRRVAMDPVGRSVRLELPGMRLDLGGIAKGYAADEALSVLRAHGASSALVVFGGDIVAGDAPPRADGWRIRIAHTGDSEREILIANEAVSTSGDTEQYIERSGVRLSHVFDPRTGTPLAGRLIATVIAQDGITADGMATAVTVLDPAARAAFIADHPTARFDVRRMPGGSAPDRALSFRATGRAAPSAGVARAVR